MIFWSGIIAGVVGVGAGVWITLGEHDISGLIGVVLGIACFALAIPERGGDEMER